MSNLKAIRGEKQDDAALREAQKKRIDEAHESIARVRRYAVELVAACDLIIDALTRPGTDQKRFDVVTRKFYRASVDTAAACNVYAAQFMVIGKRSLHNRWANFAHAVRTLLARVGKWLPARFVRRS